MSSKINKKGGTVIIKMVVLAMLVALGVVISPILRVEGMCPMAHFINIVCSVFLGPWYSLLCAVLIGVIRMTIMGIPPIALTGAVFGALLSGLLYRASNGKLIFAVIGEVVGTGIIGAIASYPVMTLWWGKTDLTLLFYVPSFILGTLIGGSIAFLFLKKLAKSGLLTKYQSMLGCKTYPCREDVLSDSFGIVFLGIILWIALKALFGTVLGLDGFVTYIPYLVLALFVVGAGIYLFVNREKINFGRKNKDQNA